MKQAVVLVSGLDSGILLSSLLDQGWIAHPFYVRCGFRWEAAELSRLRRVLRKMSCRSLKPLFVADIPVRGLIPGHWSVTGRNIPDEHSKDDAVALPGRNLFLLMPAWLYAKTQGAQAVALGTLKGNPFPDATPRFRDAAERTLNLAFGVRVRLMMPFRSLSKRQVLARRGCFPLELAFSCLAPRRGRPCGRCNKCAELAAAREAL